MAQKILILGGSGQSTISDLMLQTIKEKYGEDIVLVTPEEAKQQGLKMEDFGNIPTMKLTAPIISEGPTLIGSPNTGKENRRKRREQERKLGKKRKW